MLQGQGSYASQSWTGESVLVCARFQTRQTLAAARQWQDEDLWRSKHFCKKQRIITTWVRTIQSPLAASQWVLGWFQFFDILIHVHILTCSKVRRSNASAKNGSKTRPSLFVSCRIWVKLETQYPFRTSLSYMNLEPPRACEVKIASNKFIDPRERGFLTSQPRKVWQFWHVCPLAARTDGPPSLFWLKWIIQPGWWNDGAFVKHLFGCPVIKHARRLQTLSPNTLEFFCLYGPRNLDANAPHRSGALSTPRHRQDALTIIFDSLSWDQTKWIPLNQECMECLSKSHQTHTPSQRKIVISNTLSLWCQCVPWHFLLQKMRQYNYR